MSVPFWSISENSAARQCVVAVCNGPWLECEHRARLGVDRDALIGLLAHWDCRLNTYDGVRVVHQCINEVLYGISFGPREWEAWIGHDRSTLEQAMAKAEEVMDVL